MECDHWSYYLYDGCLLLCLYHIGHGSKRINKRKLRLMNAFQRSKKHLDMNRVKEMHEAKYQRQLIMERKEEKREEYVRQVVEQVASDWRSDLQGVLGG